MKNLVILIGNLGSDPEIKYTQSGKPVANFSVATTEKWKGQDGQMQENTEWHRIVVWGKLADICGEYLKKGSKVYLEGKITTRKWQDQNGTDKYSTEIICREMKMLSGKGETKQGNSDGGQHYQEPPEPSPSYKGEDVPF